MAGREKRLPSARQTRAAAKYQIDLPFLLLTVILVSMGVIMMYSASYALAYQSQGGNTSFFFVRQLFYAVVGFVVLFLVCIFMDYHRWRRVMFLVLLVTFVLLVLVLVIGKRINGARRWLDFGIQFQPSELAKFAVVLSFATLISSFKEKMETAKYGLLPFSVILIVYAGLLLLQPHLSATIIICGTGALMMYQGGTKPKYLFFILLAALVMLVILYFVTDYIHVRIVAWRNPDAGQRDISYQINQSLNAIGSGGLFGLGFGKSRQKYLYLPEAHNDYVFPIVCEELGLVGALLVVVIFILFILRGYWIAIHARDRFGTLLAGGLTTLFALQVFFNIGVVTNVLPPTGISLPFFSYGGTALIMQLAEVGIILNVSRTGTDKLLQ